MGFYIQLYFFVWINKVNKLEISVITSLLRYHGRQAVTIGRLSALTEYLEEVIGTLASVSPL